MRKRASTKRSRKRNKKRLSAIESLCWIAIPTAIIVLLVLDGIGVYTFNTERLLVIGSSVLVLLIPFFEEISIKSISIKKDSDPQKN